MPRGSTERRAFAPTDPEFGRQWHLLNTGQTGYDSKKGKPGADIDAVQAWSITRGRGARIAIIDTGFDVSHPDLVAGISPDSGYFAHEGTRPPKFIRGLTSFPEPADSHGTFCAGLAGARACNGLGGCGVANEAELILIACLRDYMGSQSSLAQSIEYAALHSGADVICCSLGPGTPEWPITPLLSHAIEQAVFEGRDGKGTPVFWSVNNQAGPISMDEIASHPCVIAVGKSNRHDVVSSGGHGPELDFLAPGEDVFSTLKGGAYMSSSGTSFAAPVAAGVGALVLSANPGLTAVNVREILRDTCDRIGGASVDYRNGRNDVYGNGRLNAARAVELALALRSKGA